MRGCQHCLIYSIVTSGLLCPANAFADHDQHDNPAYWQSLQSKTDQIDESGNDLRGRAHYCLAQKRAINEAFTRITKELWGRLNNNSGGYMSQSQIMAFEIRIRHKSEFGYRQINRAMHNNAPVDICDYHRDYAIQEMRKIIAVLPPITQPSDPKSGS